MPWGKYRGEPIAELPTSYLAWVLDETNIGEPHRSAIREELAERLDLAPEVRHVPIQPPAEPASVFRAMVAEGYKTLTLKHHPDRGGDLVAMQRVNAARDWARAQGLV